MALRHLFLTCSSCSCSCEGRKTSCFPSEAGNYDFLSVPPLACEKLNIEETHRSLVSRSQHLRRISWFLGPQASWRSCFSAFRILPSSDSFLPCCRSSTRETRCDTELELSGQAVTSQTIKSNLVLTIGEQKERKKLLGEKATQTWWVKIEHLEAVWAFLVKHKFSRFSFHHSKNWQSF